MKRAAAAWERFWFTPEPTSTLALFRIAIGAISFAWTLSLLPDFYTFFSAHGIEPRPPVREPIGIWGVLNTFPNYSVAIALYISLLVASLCLLVGYRTTHREHHRVRRGGLLRAPAPSIWNSGDGLLRILIFFLLLAPAGASLSVDRWRRNRDRFWEFPARAPWALRLVQIQVSVVYLSTAWLKLHGPDWLHGTAVSYTARMADYNRFPLPAVLSHSPVFSAATTYWTIAIELMVGILVWNRAARPFVLAPRRRAARFARRHHAPRLLQRDDARRLPCVRHAHVREHRHPGGPRPGAHDDGARAACTRIRVVRSTEREPSEAA